MDGSWKLKPHCLAMWGFGSWVTKWAIAGENLPHKGSRTLMARMSRWGRVIIMQAAVLKRCSISMNCCGNEL
eukprot:1153556-Pelagomonas_calceolata.AAC.4